MHRKPAPAIHTSTLVPQDVWLVADGPASIRCPWCAKWFRLKRKMLPVHGDFARFDEHTDRCPGSAQLFVLEPIGAWVSRYTDGLAEVAPRRAGAFGPKGRRQGRVTAKPQPAVPVPVCRPVPTTAHVPDVRPCACGQCKHTAKPLPIPVRHMAPSPA